jgi:hypothetical protein
VSTNTSHSAGEGLCNGLVTTDQDHDPPTTRHLFSDQAGGAGTSTIILAGGTSLAARLPMFLSPPSLPVVPGERVMNRPNYQRAVSHC